MSLRVRGSLRGRLMLLLVTGLALIWLLSAVLTAMKTRHEVDELLDAHLVQSASLLLARIGDDVDEIEAEHAPALNRYAYSLAFQVWHDGQLRLHSANAPASALGPQQRGFADSVVDGQAWRTFAAVSADGRYRVQVGELQSVRRHLARDMFMQLLSPLLLALPLFGLLVWLAVTRTLRPVHALGAALAEQHAGNLHPVGISVPRELAPLATHINTLLARLAAAFDHERRFTSDAAHELRTPLAALRTQLQVAQGATQDEERRRALAMALAAGDRATRLVQQLLTLARLDHDAGTRRAAPVTLPALVKNAFELVAEEAAANHISLAFEGTDDGLTIAGDADLLLILLRNLLDNAVRYSPAQGSVTVGLTREGGDVILTVNDTGPGIAPEKRGEALQRFRRLDASGRQGSGLGLSIVARIAELHAGRMTLREGRDGRGLCVEIRFPAKSADQDIKPGPESPAG